MAYKVIILYQLYMPSYFLGTFTEYPNISKIKRSAIILHSFSYLSFQIVAILLHFFKVYVGDFLVFSAIVRLTGIRVTLRTLLCTALLLLSLSVVHFL